MTQEVRPVVRGRFRQVLIAEDNSVLNASLARLVASWGAQVARADTLAQALQLIQKSAAASVLDLIISDIRLPDGSGEVIFERALRLPHVPLLVAVSGRASAREAFALAKLGVHTFVEKPFNSRTLEQAISDALAHRAQPRLDAQVPLHTVRGKLHADLQCFARQHALTAQQVEILRLSLSGVPRKDLSGALGVSDNTCKTTVRRLLARCAESRLTDITRKLLAQNAAPE
jgi:two-component system response regulator RegA